MLYYTSNGDDTLLGTDEFDTFIIIAGTTGPNDRIDGGAGYDTAITGAGFNGLLDLAGLISNVEELAIEVSNLPAFFSINVTTATLALFERITVSPILDSPYRLNIADDGWVTSNLPIVGGSGTPISTYLEIVGAGPVLNADMTGSSTPYRLLAGQDATGADHLTGGTEDDRIQGSGGNDILDGGPGADTIDGGSGRDTVTYLASDIGLTLNLANSSRNAGAAAGDVLASIEDVIGSHHNDTIIGDAVSNRLNGAHGNDIVHGNGGNDRLTGSNGDDQLNGGDGNDLLLGGNDNDVLAAGNGNDSLQGGSGIDFLDGGAGDDRLIGGDGDDWLVGGPGRDGYYGGAGADHLVFSGGATDDVYMFEDDIDKFVILAGADSFDDLVITSFNDGVGRQVTVDYGAGQFVIAEAGAARIDATDFLFGA